MAALSIVLFCVETGHDFHSFVLCLAPIELFVAFLKISEILRRKNLPTRKQKLFRICTSSQVLDSLAICIASLLFFSVRFVSSFKYTFSIGPVILSTTIIVLKAAFSKKEVGSAQQNEGETFGAIFLTILRIFLVLQLGNFLLKMDGFVEFSWKEVYWPFWIFFSILIGLSFSIFLIMVTKLCAYLFYRKEHSEMLTLVWLFYFIDGFTLMICLFVIYSQNYLMNNEASSFAIILAIFLAYCLFGLVFTFLIRVHLVAFVHSISNDVDYSMDSNRNLSHHQFPAQSSLPSSLKPDVKPKDKKPIEIPEFLFRYSSTFFKTATKKDILFKKLFSSGKKADVPLKREKKDSRPTHAATKSVVALGKALKKTDMSMANFHLNVKQSGELLKHFRSMSYNRGERPELLSKSIANLHEPQLRPAEDAEPRRLQAEAKVNESIANLCGVCFANEPDSVFMRCGHGGICYDCAIDIWKSTGECYLCRDEIEQILQVEPQRNELGEEYLKVIASTQLVDEEEVEAQNSKVEYIN